MKKLIFLAALAATAAFGQQLRYSATTGDVTLTGTATTLTIQQAATGTRQINLETITVFCSVACNVTQTQNGTAATATAGTLTPIGNTQVPATASAYTASNVGAGTAVGAMLHLAGGQTVIIDVSKVSLGKSGTGTNYSVTVSAISGTANLTMIEAEL